MPASEKNGEYWRARYEVSFFWLQKIRPRSRRVTGERIFMNNACSVFAPSVS